MRLYKSKLEPYDSNYVYSHDTLKSWWLGVDDEPDYLQYLALIIHDIVPHSVSCERTFSTLGWIYGRNRLKLSISKVEGIAKIRSYYISKINDELKYESKIHNKDELNEIMNEILNEDEDDNDDDGNNEIIKNDIVIPDNEIYVVIKNIFNLDKISFNKDNNENDSEEEIDDNDENNTDDDDDDINNNNNNDNNNEYNNN